MLRIPLEHSRQLESVGAFPRYRWPAIIVISPREAARAATPHGLNRGTVGATFVFTIRSGSKGVLGAATRPGPSSRAANFLGYLVCMRRLSRVVLWTPLVARWPAIFGSQLQSFEVLASVLNCMYGGCNETPLRADEMNPSPKRRSLPAARTARANFLCQSRHAQHQMETTVKGYIYANNK